MKQICVLLIIFLLPSSLMVGCSRGRTGGTTDPQVETSDRAKRALALAELVVDRAHEMWWRARREKCQGSDDLVACVEVLSPGQKAKIDDALQAFRAAEAAAEEAISLKQGRTTVSELVGKCAQAALGLLELIPEADRHVKTIQGLLGDFERRS